MTYDSFVFFLITFLFLKGDRKGGYCLGNICFREVIFRQYLVFVLGGHYIEIVMVRNIFAKLISLWNCHIMLMLSLMPDLSWVQDLDD